MRDIQSVGLMVPGLMQLQVFHFMKYHIAYWASYDHSRSSNPQSIRIFSICFFCWGSFIISSKHGSQYHFEPVNIQ